MKIYRFYSQILIFRMKAKSEKNQIGTEGIALLNPVHFTVSIRVYVRI